MKKMILSLVLASAVLPIAANAQFAKVEDAVKYRQSALSVMGTHFGRIGAVVKGDKPYDKASVERDAAIVEVMAAMPWSAFPAGSDLSNSKAKPEIWKEHEKFASNGDKLQTDTARLSAAAKSGDLAAIKTAFGSAGQTCKSCHDNFRNK
ncbi:MAG: cytochrome [Herminiimonas sp.]|nr:cytochrome [Herminiimonas sp.]MDB5855228.1 cytochrome [Herminiimonas sp.]